MIFFYFFFIILSYNKMIVDDEMKYEPQDRFLMIQQLAGSDPIARKPFMKMTDAELLAQMVKGLKIKRNVRKPRVSKASRAPKTRSIGTQTTKAMGSSINKAKMDALKAENKRAKEMVRACLKEKKVAEKALMKVSRKGVKSDARVAASRASAVKNPWLQHVAQFRASNPGMSYKDVLQRAKASYINRKVRSARASIPVPF